MALNSRQLKCIDLLVYSDMNKMEIAKELNVNKSTISIWGKLPEFQEELEKEVKNKFKALAVKATKKLDKLIDSKNDAVSLNACREILNKSGYKEVEQVEQKIEQTSITVSVENAN